MRKKTIVQPGRVRENRLFYSSRGLLALFTGLIGSSGAAVCIRVQRERCDLGRLRNSMSNSDFGSVVGRLLIRPTFNQASALPLR